MLAAGAVVLLASGVANAHVRADLVIVLPAEGATVDAPVDVVVAAASTGGTGSADFTLTLDGQLVDSNGAIGPGAAFTSLSLKAGQRKTIQVRTVAVGVHQLKVRYAAHADNAKPDLVRNFVVGNAPKRSRRLGILIVAAALLLLSAVVTLRRKRLRQR